jgi:hypothetical protein
MSVAEIKEKATKAKEAQLRTSQDMAANFFTSTSSHRWEGLENPEVTPPLPRSSTVSSREG